MVLVVISRREEGGGTLAVMSAIVETVVMTAQEREDALARLRSIFGGEPDADALAAVRTFAHTFEAPAE